jgi:hypothetical protein
MQTYTAASFIVARGLDAATMTRLRQDTLAVQREHAPYLAYLERNHNPATPLVPEQQLQLIQELDRNVP